MRVKIDFWNIKPIYEIDEYGNVYNHTRNKSRKASLGDDGYFSIRLETYSGKRNFRVSRLVARAFHGEPKCKNSIAEHIDNDTLNNFKDNIRWGDYSTNQYWHRKTHGTIDKLNDEDIHMLCKMIAEGKTTHEILQKFNIGSKRNDTERFNRFVKRISAIKRKVLYYDIYKQYISKSSTTIERDKDKYYYIDINLG